MAAMASPVGTAATAAEPIKSQKQKAAQATPDAGSAAKLAGPAAPNATPATGTTKIPPSFPMTVSEAKAEVEAANKPPEKWSDAEIAEAKAHCAVVLKRIHAVAMPHEPIKQGACGAPAPVELISIGQNPEVALSPPAIVRCDMAETLVNWLENDLQPLARKHLKSEIIKIETMSSYSCRNAYGRKSARLSEHGLANALDIGGFVTASAQTAYILADWGTPQREILEKIAVEKAAAEQRAAAAAAAKKPGQAKLAGSNRPEETPPPATASTIGSPGAGLARATIVEGVPKLTVTLPGAKPSNVAQSFPIAEPDRLGGPLSRSGKAQTPSQKALIAVTASEDVRRRPEVRAFLHEAHDAACHIFGTTLGPEANADHRNHFHVDIAPRQIMKICD
jgi:hypothetical protein